MISKDHVYSHIKTSGNLPTLPEILITLLAACDDDDTSISDIADIISKDPALSFRVLQLVNSAYYGFRHAFTSVEQAVVYLGANTIKNLAITTSVHQVFEGKKSGGAGHFDSEAFWYHSLMCAMIAKRIADDTGVGNAEEAYLSGILHDIGKLLLVSTFPKTYTTHPVTELTGPDKLRLESEQVGVNHCEAGSWLVRQWKLNSLVADAIQYHHESLEQVSEAFPLVKIVYVANLLTKGDLELGQVYDTGGALFGLDRADVEEYVKNAAEKVDQIASSMDIRVSRPQALRLNHTPRAERDDESRAVEDWGQSPASQAPSDHARTIQTAMAARVKNMSLLSSFQEDIMQAEEPEGIFAAFEKSMGVLFDIDKVLFFLPDTDGVLLRGQTSAANTLHRISRGLTLPLKQNSSLVVKAYGGGSSIARLTTAQPGKSIADQQILAIFKCSVAYLVPLVVDKKPVGVIVLGLPETRSSLPESDSQLLGIIARQVALCLHIEQEKARKTEALHKERMAAISMTARKFAHEINNPLGIISNYLMALKMKLSGEQNVLDELGIIDEEIQRISSMVSQMDMFSQAPFSQFSLIDVNEVIRDIIQLAKVSLFTNPDANVSFIPGTDLPPVKTSKDAVKQIMINLLKNAAEAMENGGRVIVRTRRPPPEGEEGEGGIEIIVSDSGPGLPETIMKNLYKPFITTKQNGHSGLGLSIIQKAVSDIGGKLFCTSSETEGTTFTINLPGMPLKT